uniref:Uncharacterized protein n=1 Tax=Sphaerodactylus townsendi TaxID=933632 RepID=A0ACB8FM00_9SAUR
MISVTARLGLASDYASGCDSSPRSTVRISSKKGSDVTSLLYLRFRGRNRRHEKAQKSNSPEVHRTQPGQ